MLLLGDEALGMGAIDAGLSIAYGYPGTPSTEIMEFIQAYAKKNGGITARWCSNEKTSYEGAVGVSYAGKKALVTMKHVGLNVASDAFINSALFKIHGGLVLAVADDPGMHSSQNEQDSRFYADFSRIICFEPRDHQEVYDMTIEAFRVSEKYHIPVMVRLVTRLSHSRSNIERKEKMSQNSLNKAENRLDWMTLPALARKDWENLLKDWKEFQFYSENSVYNKLKINSDFNDFGVITSGLGCNYYFENLDELEIIPSHLHVGVYPIPENKIRALAKQVKKIVILEEGYPYIENKIRSVLPMSMPLIGKADGTVPSIGELTPDNVRKALGLKEKKSKRIMPDGLKCNNLPGRPPQLCKGCPHKDTLDAITIALSGYNEKVVTSDIGCYALGALPPYNAVETILCMGASIGMAKGAAQAGLKNVVATIGDSTFLHSGIPALIDAVSADVNITIAIMDNSTTAMTGGQETVLPSAQIEKLVLGTGVHKDHVKVIIPLKKYTEENAALIKNEIEFNGVSVVIALRECIQTIKKNKGAGT